jgi:hypothetical protein
VGVAVVVVRVVAMAVAVFWLDGNFSSMIFGKVMAKIRHGGGSCMVWL